ncbi:MAG: hypothetical protein AUJ06_01075 [Chloroflexi bacterium 13_1_40CM_3_70_6]|nr:MAG: hypothetical protein AUJ06_01075 [Chloroflexi bacterium 13_1_40CM_3_70_6]
MRAPLFFAAALLFAAACSGSSAPDSSSGRAAADSLARGLQAHTAGKLDEATTAYFETLAKDPTNKYAFYNLRLAAAESYYRLALDQDSRMPSALFNLAIVRTSLGAPQDAVALYRQVIAADPDSAVAHFNLGLLLRQAGQTAEAQQELATAQRLDPKLIPPATPSPAGQATPTPRRT